MYGKAALVTGGVSGIGLVTSTELLRNGANVMLVDVDVDVARTVIEKLTKEFGDERVIFVKADVANKNEFEDAFKEAIKHFGGIDIVINNAGIMNERDWEKTVDVNLKGVIAGSYLAHQYMGKHNGGKGGILLNTSSLAVFLQASCAPTDTATKCGVVGFSRSLGQSYHYERSGIKVLTICPGITRTSLFHKFVPMDENIIRQYKVQTNMFKQQAVDNVGKHILSIIKNGENGTVWIIDDDKRYLVNMPTIEDIQKIEFL